jgi:hypothetical protein
VFEKLKLTQAAHEKSSTNEENLQKELIILHTNFSKTSEELEASESRESALKEELTRFYRLPSPCGVGMDLEVDMRGVVRVGALQPRMSAHASGALSEGDIVLSINSTVVSGDTVESSKNQLIGKRASMVAIEVQRGKQTFVVNLKRGAWGPEHSFVSTEQAMSSTTKRLSKNLFVSADEKKNEPRPSNLEAPSRSIPGNDTAPQPRRAWQTEDQSDDPSLEGSLSGGGRVVVQGNYAAARRSQGPGALVSTPE